MTRAERVPGQLTQWREKKNGTAVNLPVSEVSHRGDGESGLTPLRIKRQEGRRPWLRLDVLAMQLQLSLFFLRKLLTLSSYQHFRSDASPSPPARSTRPTCWGHISCHGDTVDGHTTTSSPLCSPVSLFFSLPLHAIERDDSKELYAASQPFSRSSGILSLGRSGGFGGSDKEGASTNVHTCMVM